MGDHEAPETATQVAVRADARSRSIRTLLQGLALDVVVTIVVVLSTFIGDLEWTKEYWALLGAAVAKSVVTAAVSYFSRIFVAPKPPPVEEG